MYNNKTIGILYICTGPYSLFWNEFFTTFEKNFLRNTKKKYFVFTDSSEIKETENIKVINIENQPWPLITLLRFRTFLMVEDDLMQCDYIMFSNANIICDAEVLEEDFLPQGNEQIFVTTHPGYYGKSIIDFPYDRNKKSLAYVPWNCGNDYVIGAMFGGTRKGFLNLCKTLKQNIEEDLKKNIIARWHDESHLNRYIIGRNDIKILSPEYCYPYGMKVDYFKRISAVSKQDKFNVKEFKGQYSVNQSKVRKMIGNVKRKLKLKERLYFVYFLIIGKKI